MERAIDQEYSMKICKRLLCGSLTLLTLLLAGPIVAQPPGDGPFQPPSFQPLMSDLNVAWPGRVWVQASLADEGLGYQGSYFTLGAKTHVFEDFLDGRWLLETRGHFDPDENGFFTNIGLERVFSLAPAESELTASIWYDYDDSIEGPFAHDLQAIGVSGGIKTRRWDWFTNGYFPIGEVDFAQGDPTGVDCFFGNSIVVRPGLDSGLRGFDSLVRFKPSSLAQVNGSLALGGYGYGSELVEFFGGVRARAGFQTARGLIVNAEINHDNRFDVTGVLQLGWLFGAGARGTEYGLLGTDLEPTIRNDHIVRFRQDLLLAIDPDTGLPYDVFHVDNTASGAAADGTVDRPFTTLVDAQLASGTDDIIFVREGDGTTQGMDQGVVLQDGQLLLGDGVQHLIPLLGGTNFVLCNDIDGNRPRITNVNGGNAVTLADRNTVRGFIIDGSQGGMLNGISGVGGLGDPLSDGIIEDVLITGSPILNGIFLNNIAGNWRFARNDVQTAPFDGIFINNACDPTSIFEFDSNIVSNNGRDGIHIQNYDGATFRFVNNTTNNNVRDGIRLENFKNGAGTGAFLDFVNPTANGNQNDGLAVRDFVGNVRFINSNILNNINNGITLIDVRTPAADQMVFIGTSGGGTSVINGNGVGAGAGVFNLLNTALGIEQLLITNTTIDGGGIGVNSSATAVGANLRTDIVDNLSISGNQSDGIRLLSSGGASHTATIINSAAAGPLVIDSNQGNGINLFSSGVGPVSLLEVDIENVNITNSGISAINATVTGDAQMILRTRNVTIANAGVDGVQINVDNRDSVTVNEFRFNALTIGGVADDGFDLNIGDQSFVDFSLTNSTLNNANIGNHGVEVNITGDDTNAAIDSRLRLNIVANVITGFDSGDGIDIQSNGDAHVFAQIVGNSITGNGINQVATGQPAIPFGDGIDITAADDSQIFTRILNNQITGNAEQGVDIDTVGDGQVTALLVNNFISGNDTQDDATTPVNEANNADMTVNNDVTGNICIAMSTNFFSLPVIFNNLSGPANFRVELDGLTNGPGVPVFLPGPGAFTIGPFSTICSPAIDAEEAAFEANGFVPLP